MTNHYNSSPLISVILPTYNGEKHIAETLQSIIDQTYKNLEIVIVDDNSTDKTVDIIRSFSDERVKLYINDKNLGIGGNTNRALSLARGEFIMMQDHDDISSPYRAALLLKCLIDNPNISIVGSNSLEFKNNPPAEIYTEINSYTIAKQPEELKLNEIFLDYLQHPTIFYRRAILDNLDSYYHDKIKVAGDLFFIEKLNRLGLNSALLKDNLMAYRIHDNMTTKIDSDAPKSYATQLLVSINVTKRYLNGISDENALMYAKILFRRELIDVDNIILVKHFREILELNTDPSLDDAFRRKTESVFRSATILSNIYNPFKAYKVYLSIDKFRPYNVSLLKFLKEWQKRFIRAMKWKFIRNKVLPKK